MNSVDEFKEIFYEKLGRTNSLDAAFTKAVWKAWLAGHATCEKELQMDVPKYDKLIDYSELTVQLQPLAHRLYENLARREWEEAEDLSLKLKQITDALHNHCVMQKYKK